MTDVVLDIGCFPHKGRDSLSWLAKAYEPALLLGFDPHPDQPTATRRVEKTTVAEMRTAAWTRNRRVFYDEDGWESRTGVGTEVVDCFDLAALLRSFAGLRTVLKMDVEGAEYTLLPHLAAEETWPSLLLVEWHPEHDHAGTQEALINMIGCPFEEWHL